MRPKGSKKELEERRRLAVTLYREGWTTREVAREMGCAPGSVSRWLSMYEAEGREGLTPIPNAGGQPRLGDKDRNKLNRLLLRGARKAGFHDDTWTLRRVAHLIEKQFGVQYHIGHVSRLLHGLGFSPQKPTVQARERDDDAVKEFRDKTWKHIKKKRGGRGARS